MSNITQSKVEKILEKIKNSKNQIYYKSVDNSYTKKIYLLQFADGGIGHLENFTIFDVTIEFGPSDTDNIRLESIDDFNAIKSKLQSKNAIEKE